MAALPQITWPLSGFNSCGRLEHILQGGRKWVTVEALTVILDVQQPSPTAESLSMLPWRWRQTKNRHVCNSEACLTCLVQTDQLVTRETRHSKWGNRYQVTGDVDKSDAQSLMHINEVLYRCFHGLQWWFCAPPPFPTRRREDLSQHLLQNTDNEWPCVEFHAVLQHCAMYFQMSFHSTCFEICNDFGQLTNDAPPPISMCKTREDDLAATYALQSDEG